MTKDIHTMYGRQPGKISSTALLVPGRRSLLSGLMLSLLLALSGIGGNAYAQANYPNKPIRLIVPFPAGESIDAIARIITKPWSALLGQPIIVENRPGAGGLIGSADVAKAAPDGYTLLMGNVGGLGILPALKQNMPYDALKDFTPVAQVSNVPFFLFVSSKLPVKSVQELIEYAKKNPGKLNFPSTGIGSGPHLAGEFFKYLTKINVVHVPYKGVSQALPELISGKVHFVFYPSTFIPYVKDGSLRPLLIASDHPSVALPDVPTSADVGLPDLIAGSWHAIVAPAGTSPEVVKKLNQTLVAALAEKDIRNQMIAIGVEPVGGSPEQLGEFMAKQIKTLKTIGEVSGIKLD